MRSIADRRTGLHKHEIEFPRLRVIGGIVSAYQCYCFHSFGLHDLPENLVDSGLAFPQRCRFHSSAGMDPERLVLRGRVRLVMVKVHAQAIFALLAGGDGS